MAGAACLTVEASGNPRQLRRVKSYRELARSITVLVGDEKLVLPEPSGRRPVEEKRVGMARRRVHAIDVAALGFPNKLWMRQVLGPGFEPRLARAGFAATGGTGSVLAFRPNPDALARAALAWE